MPYPFFVIFLICAIALGNQWTFGVNHSRPHAAADKSKNLSTIAPNAAASKSLLQEIHKNSATSAIAKKATHAKLKSPRVETSLGSNTY